MVIDYQFLDALCEQLLKKNNSIWWAGFVNDNGVILNSKQKAGTLMLLTQEENEEYAISAVSRHQTRTKYEPKIGKLRYAVGKYEKLNRATIPITKFIYLLLILDKDERNFDSIIMEKVLPIVESSSARLVNWHISKHQPSEYECGTFRCTSCAKEFITKEEADKHHYEVHEQQESVHANE